MYPLLQHAHGERAREHAAQRGGEPELLVVAAAAVEADDERGAADARRQMIDVVRQVVAARFLAGLDEDDAARMRHALVVQGGDGRERAEHRIAVIGTAAAVELVALDERRPRAIALEPADHLGLLVEMAVEEHGLLMGASGGAPRCRHLDEDDGRPALEPHDLEAGAGEAGELPPRPAFKKTNGVLHIAVHRPVGVEGGRLVWDLDVLDEGRHHLVIPALADELAEPRRVHRHCSLRLITGIFERVPSSVNRGEIGSSLKAALLGSAELRVCGRASREFRIGVATDEADVEAVSYTYRPTALGEAESQW